MADKIWLLIPELILFAAVVVNVVLGLSPQRRLRSALPGVSIGALILACIATPLIYTADRTMAAGLLMPMLGKYAKMGICIVGVFLAMLTVGMIDRKFEASIEDGSTAFDPIRTNRAEFYSFFLLSLIGVMLCCNANDLIWLFLALELTSLPTYVMVAMSRGSAKAQEAAVKYFFLGAMATAVFLFGFAMLYGSTGTIVLTDMRDAFAQQAAGEGINLFGITGMILAILGLSFKIAAAPMHFYAADVYEGAASPVTAFLAFVPKTAGFISLILLLGTIGWSTGIDGVGGLPEPILKTLWMISVLTMFLGNFGALLQNSVKRILAYSSIAHSGYVLIGIIAGPAIIAGTADGLAAVLFYLFAYGIMNTAAFAVLAGLERNGEEIDSVDDLAGLRLRHPGMAIVMAISAMSLLGVPPLLGFIGKLALFMAGVEAGQIALVVIAGVNSAISAVYYLRLVGLPILSNPSAQAETIEHTPVKWGRVAGIVTAVAVVLLPVFSGPLLGASEAALGDGQVKASADDDEGENARVEVVSAK